MNLTILQALKNSLKITDLKILCTGELEVEYQDLLELQILEDGRSLKDTDDEKILKLAESLLRFGIVNNLQVWFDKKQNCHCFDAHHRKKALEILAQTGLKIPPLPATRCLAKTKNEARKLLLIKESRTSWVNLEVIPDYLREINFNIDIAERVIDLPEFSWGDVDENIPEFTPELPTDERKKIIKTEFIFSHEQFSLIFSLIKKEIQGDFLINDPAGINENKNGNALYSICRKIYEKEALEK